MSLAKAERHLDRAKRRGWKEFEVAKPYSPVTPFVVGLVNGSSSVQHGATTREDALWGALKKAGML